MSSADTPERLLSTQRLLDNKITTLEDFKTAINDPSTAFLALDTQHVKAPKGNHPILQQLGLAFTEALGQVSPYSYNKNPPIHEFYRQHRTHGITLNVIKVSEADHQYLTPDTLIPYRKPHRFGLEEHVDAEEIEEAILEFIETFVAPDLNLILVGFQTQTIFADMERHFPRLIPYFSAWMDVRDIAKNIEPKGNLPALKETLRLFGYTARDVDQSVGPAYADTAGDEAVFTLAAAHGLLHEDIRHCLYWNQRVSKIADTFVENKGYVVDGEIRHLYAVMVWCEGIPLPESINTGMKLAKRFSRFDPESAGCWNAEYAYLTFKNYDDLEHFVKWAHGCRLPHGHVMEAVHLTYASHCWADAQVRAIIESGEELPWLNHPWDEDGREIVIDVDSIGKMPDKKKKGWDFVIWEDAD